MFDLIHIMENYPFFILEDVSREVALEFVEERIISGQFSGKKFQKVSLNKYKSLDGQAIVIIKKRNKND